MSEDSEDLENAEKSEDMEAGECKKPKEEDNDMSANTTDVEVNAEATSVETPTVETETPTVNAEEVETVTVETTEEAETPTVNEETQEETTDAPTVNETETDTTAETVRVNSFEQLKDLVTPELLAVLEQGQAKIKAEKDAVITKITSNANNMFSADELSVKELDELNKIASLIGNVQEVKENPTVNAEPAQDNTDYSVANPAPVKIKANEDNLDDYEPKYYSDTFKN